MSATTKIAVGVASGYLLGRTKKLQDQLTGRLLEAAKAAALTTATSRLEAVTKQLTAGPGELLEGDEDEYEDEEAGEEEEAEPEDEYEEEGEAEEEPEAEDEGEEPEAEADEEPEEEPEPERRPRRRTARRSASKAAE